jgi:hypothetical protein
MIVSLLGGLLTYLLTLIFLTSSIDLFYLLEGMNTIKVFIIAFINWFPLYLIVKIQAKLYPKSYEKLNYMKMKDQKADKKLRQY